MSATLYSGLVLYSASDPEASAVLVDGGVLAWVGAEDSARALFPEVRTLDVTGGLMTPGFVDAAAGEQAEAPVREDAAALARGIVARLALRPGRHDGVHVAAPVTAPEDLMSLSRAGVPLALGSDAAAEAADPWSWVRAAARQGPVDHRLSDRAAFLAATRGGLRLLGAAGNGQLRTGAEATFVLWEPWDLTVRGQGATIETWSTDPRSRTPLLPELDQGSPRALRTVIAGEVLHDALGEGTA